MERDQFDADAKLREAQQRYGEDVNGVRVVVETPAPTHASSDRSPVVYGHEAQMPIGYAVAAAHMVKASTDPTGLK